MIHASDDDLLVLLRDGFEGGDGAGIADCGAASAASLVDLPAGHALVARPVVGDRKVGRLLDGNAFTVETVSVADDLYVRLTGLADDGGAQAGAWLGVRSGETLVLLAEPTGTMATTLHLQAAQGMRTLVLPLALSDPLPVREACLP